MNGRLGSLSFVRTANKKKKEKWRLGMDMSENSKWAAHALQCNHARDASSMTMTPVEYGDQNARLLT